MKTLPNPVGSFLQPLILVTVVGLFSEASRAQLPIVDPVVRPTTVAIEATRRIAEESSFPFRRLALRGTFTISRTGPTNNSQPVFVHYRGSATPGKDYEALPFLVSIPAGSTSTELSVVAIPDDDAEPIEIVEAELSECPPATTPPLGIPCFLVNIDPAHASARVFIRDDGMTTASLEITAPVDGSKAAAGTTIPIQATAIDLDGAITDVDFYDGKDKIGESHIQFFVQPEPGTPVHHQFDWTGAANGPHLLTTRAVAAAGNAVTSAPVSILVVAELPVVSIEATVPETTEPSINTRVRPAVFTVHRTEPINDSLRVLLQFGGTAIPGVDYQAPLKVVEFAAGAASADVLIAPLDDELVEGDETVVAELIDSPAAVAILPSYRIDPLHARARVVIHDNDLPTVPVIRIQATRAETSEPLCPPHTCLAPEPAPGVFVVSREGGDLGQPLSVLIATGGTATPGLDYVALPTFVLFAAGEASVELDVVALFDELVEGDETVVTELLPDPSLGPIERYRLDPAQNAARVVIHDRTPPPVLPVVSIVATDPLAREGAASTTANTATFVIRRAGGTNEPLKVYFAVGGSATPGTDYRQLSSPVTIAAGQRGAVLTVVALEDHQPEPPETVVVTLLPTAPDGTSPTYTLGRPFRGAALILDADLTRPPCVRLPDGLFNLCVPVKTNRCFRVEATEDLKDWTPLCIIPANEDAAHFIDPDVADLAHRFYRIVPDNCDLDP